MKGQKRQVVDGKLECSKCGEWKSFDEFYAAKHTSTGKRSNCRACEGSLLPPGDYGKRHIEPVDGKFQCRICGEWKPLELFEKNKASKFGVMHRCGACSIKRYQEFVSRSPFNFLRHTCRSARHAARQRGKRSAESFSKQLLDEPETLVELYEKQKGLCALTGVKMTYAFGERRCWTNISIDRVDASKGYERGNVRLVCLAANLMRNDMSDAELLTWAKRIVKHKKE